MSLQRDYRDAVLDAVGTLDDAVSVLPLLLSRACVEVLPVAGAGVSLTAELRVPLSASSADVAAAEQLQTSLGDGPCLSAVHQREPVSATFAEMRQDWPVYTSELVRRTPFRSVASLPLRFDGERLGAVDLYSVEPDAPFGVLADVLEAVIDPLADILVGQCDWLPGSLSGLGEPSNTVSRRLQVWTAVGMVVAGRRVSSTDALAILRGYAFSHELDLETLAERLTSRTLTTDQLAAG